MKTCIETDGWKNAQIKAIKTAKAKAKANEEKYLLNPKVCKHCNKIIEYKKRKNKFCSHSCAASFNNLGNCKNGKPVNKVCLNCNNKLNRNAAKYCSSKCQTNYEYNSYIEHWKNGEKTGIIGQDSTSVTIKRYLFEKYDNKCCECGWNELNTHTNKIPLQLEHIDGNWKNNKEENLKLLCPNCHSLTSTYGGANRGNGRPYRYKLK